MISDHGPLFSCVELKWPQPQMVEVTSKELPSKELPSKELPGWGRISRRPPGVPGVKL